MSLAALRHDLLSTRSMSNKSTFAELSVSNRSNSKQDLTTFLILDCREHVFVAVFQLVVFGENNRDVPDLCQDMFLEVQYETRMKNVVRYYVYLRNTYRVRLLSCRPG